MHKLYFGNELYHHGVKGQKWGVRRYQNTDGSYKANAEGRYDPDSQNTIKKNSKFKQFKNRWTNRRQYLKDTNKLQLKLSNYKYNEDEAKRYSKLAANEKKNPTPKGMVKDSWKGINAVKHYTQASTISLNANKDAVNYYKQYMNKYGKAPLGALSQGYGTNSASLTRYGHKKVKAQIKAEKH